MKPRPVLTWSRVLVVLLAGAFLNILAAWASAVWAPWQRFRADEGYSDSPYGPPAPQPVLALIPPAWLKHLTDAKDESTYIHVEHVRGFGVTARLVSVDSMIPGADKGPGFDHALLVVEAGWPMRSVSASNSLLRPPFPGPLLLQVPMKWGDWEWGVPAPGWAKAHPSGLPRYAPVGRLLPLVPLPLGFAVNTAAYAGVILMLWVVPGALRQRHRRASGRCVECGYDMAGLATKGECPECGTPAVTAKQLA